MTGSGTREETQHTVLCQRSGTPHPVKVDQRAAAKDPRIRNHQKPDLRDEKRVVDMILYKKHKIIPGVMFVIIYKFIPDMIFTKVEINYSLYDFTY